MSDAVTAMSDAVEYRRPTYGADDGFLIPVKWLLKEDPDMTRRAPVLDQVNRDRVVRYVGWRRCLICKKPFFSEDVVKNRICDAVHVIQD